MNPKDIVSKLTSLSISEKRQITDEYGEIVVLNTPELDKLLIDTFGPAIKKYSEKPNTEALNLTKQYGGIRNNQALFRLNFATHVLVAMLWPWDDKQHITVKIAAIKLKK